MKKDGPKEMEVEPALALPDGLELVACERIDDVLTMIIVSTQESPCCPRCGRPSTRIHSRYTRQVTDLPCGGQHLHLVLHVRKFFCDTANCVQKIFVERLTPFIEPWARVTLRLCADCTNAWPCDWWEARCSCDRPSDASKPAKQPFFDALWRCLQSQLSM